MELKIKYAPPSLKIFRVVLEDNLAQTVAVSVEPRLLDWEDGGVIGDDPSEGGDVYLYY